MSEPVRPKQNIPDGDPVIVRQPDGTVVSKQYYTNGNIRTRNLFPAQYPDAKPEAPRKPKGVKGE